MLYVFAYICLARTIFFLAARQAGAQRQHFFDCGDYTTTPRTCLRRVFGKWRNYFHHIFKASHRGNKFSIASTMRFCSANGGRGTYIPLNVEISPNLHQHQLSGISNGLPVGRQGISSSFMSHGFASRESDDSYNFLAERAAGSFEPANAVSFFDFFFPDFAFIASEASRRKSNPCDNLSLRISSSKSLALPSAAICLPAGRQEEPTFPTRLPAKVRFLNLWRS